MKGLAVRYIGATTLIRVGTSWTKVVKSLPEYYLIAGIYALAVCDDRVARYETRQLGLYCGDRSLTCAGTAYERSCGNEEQRDL
jgi:hypothetical protein